MQTKTQQNLYSLKTHVKIFFDKQYKDTVFSLKHSCIASKKLLFEAKDFQNFDFYSAC